MGLDFCRNSIAYEILGEKDGKKYVPIITTIFFAVFFFNITGVIPFLNIAGTSVIGLPIIFALWVYFMYLWQGVKKFGVGGYLKHSLFPPGRAVAHLHPADAGRGPAGLPAAARHAGHPAPGQHDGRPPAARPVLRGHLVPVLRGVRRGLKAFGAVTFVAGFAFFLLEVFVAALQAYVFSILTAVYLQMSISEEH